MRGDAPSKPVAQSKQMSQMVQMTKALARHRAEGNITTLRQLHKICELTQPQALTVVTELEQAGIVTIDHNISDAFESVIRLDHDAEQLLSETLERLIETANRKATTSDSDASDKAAA